MKRALITGASSGIGMQLAKAYLADGWHVTACGRSTDKLQEALGSENYQLSFCCFELNSRNQVLSSTTEVEPLDLAVLNAGTCEYIDEAQEFDSELFERVVTTNVIGTGYCLEAILPKIKSGGQLAIVSSTVTLLPLTRSEAYGASKAALDYLTRTLAIDLASKKIDVSLIRPGFVDTPLTRKNTFSMPGIIDGKQASRFIKNGLSKRKQEINFPPGFYYALKGLSLLPNPLWRRIAIKMIRPAI